MATSGIDSATTALILAAMHGGTAVTFGGTTRLLFNSVQRTVDTGADTEWATAAGYTAGTGATVAFAAASAGAPSTQVSNSAATITNAPAGTWAGCTESDGTKKLFWAALTSAKTVNLGDTVTVPSGQLTDSLG